MKLFNIVIAITFLTSCASMATSGFDKSNTVGRDVDEVIQDMQKKGLSCGKYKDKEVFTNKVVGGVKCFIKEKALVCPKSYYVYLGYDLNTNKVDAIGEKERENCF